MRLSDDERIEVVYRTLTEIEQRVPAQMWDHRKIATKVVEALKEAEGYVRIEFDDDGVSTTFVGGRGVGPTPEPAVSPLPHNAEAE